MHICICICIYIEYIYIYISFYIYIYLFTYGYRFAWLAVEPTKQNIHVHWATRSDLSPEDSLRKGIYSTPCIGADFPSGGATFIWSTVLGKVHPKHIWYHRYSPGVPKNIYPLLNPVTLKWWKTCMTRGWKRNIDRCGCSTAQHPLKASTRKIRSESLGEGNGAKATQARFVSSRLLAATTKL